MSRTLRIDRGEGDIAGPLGALAAEFSDLSIGSYPFQKDGKFGANIVLRGTDEARLETALSQLKALFAE
jgi:molybdopterin-biosynthesis enzyme MoeA-like protein